MYITQYHTLAVHSYIQEHLGEHLFVLFRATKSQLEKGPVDVLTGEAKNSLSEEKLLRQHFDVKVHRFELCCRLENTP